MVKLNEISDFAGDHIEVLVHGQVVAFIQGYGLRDVYQSRIKESIAEAFGDMGPRELKEAIEFGGITRIGNNGLNNYFRG